LKFDDIPPLSPNYWTLSSLFWVFFSHPSTNQARSHLASETRWDWTHSEWYGHRLKIFLDWSFFFLHCKDLFFPGFFWLVGFGPMLWEK
jgi:hypothetical protein